MSLIQDVFQNPVGLLFTVIASGILIGKLSIGKLRLGGSGVLISGLLFGHFGHILPSSFQTIGVVFFVYAIGLKAGPHILESLKKSKGVFVVLAVMIVSSAGILTWFFRQIFDFPADMMAGIYAGALTSTPALAAAMETTGNSTPSIGYGLAYPLGILGIILLVQVLPIFMKIDLKKEEELFRHSFSRPKIRKQAFRLTNTNINSKSIGEVFADSKNCYRVVRVQRADKIFSPRVDDSLQLNDVLLVVGDPNVFEQLNLLIGERVEDLIPESEESRSHWMTISSRKFIGKKLGNFEIATLYDVIITRIKREDIEFIPSTNFVLEAGDQLRVSGSPTNLERFHQLIGKDQDALYEIGWFSLAIGLTLGVLLGMIKIPISSKLTVGLGIAGGPLLAGLIFGYVGRFGRITGRMPQAAQRLLGDMGLFMFLAVAGSVAGEHFVEVLSNNGIALILCGFLISVVPAIVTIFAARYIFKMNMLVILGMICGGMTSTPALGVLTDNTKSDIPALSYTGIYPTAVVLTTIMAQILVLF